MGKGLQRSLQIYLSKLRKAMQVELRRHSTSWLLSACNSPRTPSFTGERHQPPAFEGGDGPAMTLADAERFLFENFNSLYGSCDGEDDADGGAAAHGDHLAGRRLSPPPPGAVDLPADVHASQRFVTSPTTSNSLPEEARPSAPWTTSSSYSYSSSSPSSSSVPGTGVAVMTFSKDPYEDFRQSMDEMVEARYLDPGELLDWDFMEDLLISYLELNDRCVHRHILRAFTDLVVAIRRERPHAGGRRGIPPTALQEEAGGGRGASRGGESG